MVRLDILGACNSVPYGTEQNRFQFATELKECRTLVALHSGGGEKGLRGRGGVALPNQRLQPQQKLLPLSIHPPGLRPYIHPLCAVPLQKSKWQQGERDILYLAFSFTFKD